MAPPEIYDAIIVGSGASGGWAAKQLTEAGMRVLLLEAGGPPVNSDWRFYQHKVLKKLGREVQVRPEVRSRQPIQSQCYYAWESYPESFVDDLDHPYTTPEDRPFTWIRSRQIGGRMAIKTHGRQFYRFSDLDFKAASRDGYGDDWPLSYAELVPYYEKIERWIGVQGTPEQLPQLPDSVFLPARPMTPGEQAFKAAVEGRWPERRVTLRRQSPTPATLAAARRTGRLTLRSHAIAYQITTDRQTGKARSVAFVDQQTQRSYEVQGRIVILCASTIESTRLLLNSANPQHPNGLGNSSGVLGHYLMDHSYTESVLSFMPIPDKSQLKQAAIVAYIPQFRNVGGDRHPDFLRGYGIQVGTTGSVCQMLTYGEMLPRWENCVRLNREVTDTWGIPVAHIDCTYGDNDRAMARDQVATCKEMVEAAGFEVLQESTDPAPPGLAVHEVGTARMGSDPRTSVLNAFNQSWDVPNLFVTDGSCFVSQGCQNPTLTIMALTVRACDYMIHQAKRGEL